MLYSYHVVLDYALLHYPPAWGWVYHLAYMLLYCHDYLSVNGSCAYCFVVGVVEAASAEPYLCHPPHTIPLHGSTISPMLVAILCLCGLPSTGNNLLLLDCSYFNFFTKFENFRLDAVLDIFNPLRCCADAVGNCELYFYVKTNIQGAANEFAVKRQITLFGSGRYFPPRGVNLQFRFPFDCK